MQMQYGETRAVNVPTLSVLCLINEITFCFQKQTTLGLIWKQFISRTCRQKNIVVDCCFPFQATVTWHLQRLAKDLLNPSSEEEKRKHKKKRLVQCPNSYFMDVKCPGCYKITTVFSHAQTVVLCVGCSTVLCQPTGGKARLTEGCSFRRKQH